MTLFLFPIGYLASFGFAPHDHFIALVIGMALLFGYAHNQPSFKQRFLAGLFWGAGLHISTAEWTYASMQTLDHPVMLSWILCVAFNGLLGAFYGLFSALMRYFHGRRLGWYALATAALWTLCEWLKAYALQGFPWLVSGYASTDTLLANIVPYLGVFGASFGLALSIALVVNRRLTERMSTHSWGRLAAMIVLWGGLWLLPNAPIQPTGETLNVALIQGNIEQKRKWKSEQFAVSMQQYLQLSQQASTPTQLIIWPESAITRYPYQLTHSLKRQWQQLADEKKATLLSGIVIQHDPHLFNAMIDLNRPWRSWHYAKRHLVPFTEFLPFQAQLSPMIRWATGETPLTFQAGPAIQQPLRIGHIPIGLSICYELAFWEHTADALPFAQVLINISNEAWFAGTEATAQMTQIGRIRALEAGRYLLRATNTGRTSVINPQGNVVAQLPENQADLLQYDTPMMEGLTWFSRWGNQWLFGLFLPLLVSGLFRQKQRL